VSKKHFIAIAADIKWQVDHCDGNVATLDVIRSIAVALSMTFKNCNSQFDRQRFLDACGF
jgi:hypothetical protein